MKIKDMVLYFKNEYKKSEILGRIKKIKKLIDQFEYINNKEILDEYDEFLSKNNFSEIRIEDDDLIIIKKIDNRDFKLCYYQRESWDRYIDAYIVRVKDEKFDLEDTSAKIVILIDKKIEFLKIKNFLERLIDKNNIYRENLIKNSIDSNLD